MKHKFQHYLACFEEKVQCREEDNKKLEAEISALRKQFEEEKADLEIIDTFIQENPIKLKPKKQSNISC